MLFHNVAGGSLPPAMVFPRVNFVQKMLKNCVSYTLGLANKTGWMTANLFLEVNKHFIKYSNASIQNY